MGAGLRPALGSGEFAGLVRPLKDPLLSPSVISQATAIASALVAKCTALGSGGGGSAKSLLDTSVGGKFMLDELWRAAHAEAEPN